MLILSQFSFICQQSGCAAYIFSFRAREIERDYPHVHENARSVLFTVSSYFSHIVLLMESNERKSTAIASIAVFRNVDVADVAELFKLVLEVFVGKSRGSSLPTRTE